MTTINKEAPKKYIAKFASFLDTLNNSVEVNTRLTSLHLIRSQLMIFGLQLIFDMRYDGRQATTTFTNMLTK